ncbi:MAG: cell division protein SepF [Ruminococcaceae bacterium]|nr:cell division protein SepF [Oscillospiraceae bacterium]
MFDALRKKLARAANEDEEIIFKPYEERPVAQTATAAQPANDDSSALEGNNIELKVVRPESIDEIFTIADYLMSGCTVVLNLEVITGDVVTRMLDFLNGVTYTTGGEIKNVSQGTYIITPNGINLNK